MDKLNVKRESTWLIRCSEEELNTIIRSCVARELMNVKEIEHAKIIGRALIELRDKEIYGEQAGE